MDSVSLLVMEHHGANTVQCQMIERAARTLRPAALDSRARSGLSGEGRVAWCSNDEGGWMVGWLVG